MKKTWSCLLFVFLLTACNLPMGNGTSSLEPEPASTPTITPTPVTLVCENETCAQAGVQFDYLIVTRPKFIEALTDFINWKTGNGFRVGLVTVEWLDATYAGRHMAEKMKTGMHELRKNAGVKYVLLVGDTEMARGDNTVQNVLNSYNLSMDFNVPTGFYRRVNDDPPQEVLPSDAYFVEDRDWDPDNTGLNPRPDNMETGDGTLQADLYLGRWSVREPEEIAVLFNKTRQVGIANEILFATDYTFTDGVSTWCDQFPPVPGNGMSCYTDTMVTGRTLFFEENAPHITTESYFVHLHNLEEAFGFFDEFLASQGVVVISFHGTYDCVEMQPSCVEGEDFQFENVFPLLEIEACLVAAFFSADVPVVTESLSLSPTGPAIVTEAPNAVLFLRDLRDGKPVGEAFWGTATTWVYWPNPMLLLGDPSLVIFTGP